jgi:tetratricopeptide (TPR) repeat protein
MLDLTIGLIAIALLVPSTLFVASLQTLANKKRLLAQYKEAFERGDVAEATRLRALVRAGLPDSLPVRNSELVGQGELLLLEERWAEARDVLAKVDRSLLPEANRPGVLSNLAYATAQAGEPERGVELVGRALAEAAAQGTDYPPEKLPFLRGTHGVALSLAGRHDDAIAHLEPLAPITKPKRARSTRLYFLAQSYRALGRFDDTVRTLSLSADGEGRFAQRAREALAKLHPHRT